MILAKGKMLKGKNTGSVKFFDAVTDIFWAKLFKVDIHLYHVLPFIYSGCILLAVAHSFNPLLPP